MSENLKIKDFYIFCRIEDRLHQVLLNDEEKQYLNGFISNILTKPISISEKVAAYVDLEKINITEKK